MHIAEGVLSPAQCAVWYAAAAPFVVHGGYRVVKEVKEHPENKLLLATAGAFTFVLSAIKLPSVTGSSSHPTGTGVGAALFKPPVMAFLGMIVSSSRPCSWPTGEFPPWEPILSRWLSRDRGLGTPFTSSPRNFAGLTR